MLTTVLAFLLTLGVLIVVHEYGHYRVAVACGVKVLRFSIGFGRVIWRRERGADKTEFVLSALPLGGYVRMLDEREGPVDPAELGRAFNRKSLWQRTAIVAAGPVANLGLAVLLYAASHWIGVDEPKAVLGSSAPSSLAEKAGLRAGDWVRASSQDGESWQDVRSMNDLRWAITQAALQGQDIRLSVSDRAGHGERRLDLRLSQLVRQDVDATVMRQVGLGPAFSEPVMGDVVAGGPAERAGLRKGDRVLRVDGQPIPDAQVLFQLIRGSVKAGAAAPMQWEVERGAQTMAFLVQPRVMNDGKGLFGRIDAVIAKPFEMVKVQYGFVEGLTDGVTRTWEVSALSLKMLGRMVIGEASLKNLSGPLTIADFAGQSIQRGLAYYIGFLAMVSVSLGVLNLLPLPMLDGGHLMYYLFEALTGRPVPERWLDRLQRGGVALLLLMMSVALFNDVARLFGLH